MIKQKPNPDWLREMVLATAEPGPATQAGPLNEQERAAVQRLAEGYLEPGSRLADEAMHLVATREDARTLWQQFVAAEADMEAGLLDDMVQSIERHAESRLHLATGTEDVPVAAPTRILPFRTRHRWMGPVTLALAASLAVVAVVPHFMNLPSSVGTPATSPTAQSQTRQFGNQPRDASTWPRALLNGDAGAATSTHLAAIRAAFVRAYAPTATRARSTVAATDPCLVSNDPARCHDLSERAVRLGQWAQFARMTCNQNQSLEIPQAVLDDAAPLIAAVGAHAGLPHMPGNANDPSANCTFVTQLIEGLTAAQ